MLALSDSALARLCIGATRVRRERRGQWLRKIAERVDPPSHHRADMRARKARHRAHQRQSEVENRWGLGSEAMFVLLQVYPLEATAEDGSDSCCCLDVIAVDPSEAALRRYLTAYEPRYRAACAASDLWDDMAKDWSEEHDRMLEQVAREHQVYGALVAGTRFRSRDA
jgi:hypothetical protein